MLLSLLCVLLFASHILSFKPQAKCDERTQYFHNGQCCKKCKPGEFMEQPCVEGSTETTCRACGSGYFMNEFNDNLRWCRECTSCSKEHVMYKTCNATSDAVCGCKEGYTCNDSKCQECEKVALPPAPSALPPAPQDNVWIWVSLSFASLSVLFTCFLLSSRYTQSCGRIMSASAGFWSSTSNSGSSHSTEEEEVPMPVQEVCGKMEKLEEV
ncbi:hypothetical protein DNTS_030370 [Danionella cerebrum]|uniref:TNFR-Cys domain-containing protein n=1 Tax=Danionella cerebrum TaxID=2873325 RepID=A0A553QWD6_9TELE|nr:hypothetical protein DNTS_030370 [Danionella translucida]